MFRTLLVVFLVASVGATAQPAEIPEAREAISRAVNPARFGDRAGFAAAMMAYCDALLAATPRNTPRENDWVEAEGHTSDMARVRRLASSVEYARRTLVMNFEDCRTRASNALRAQAANASRAEAASFVSLAVSLRYPDLLYHARTARLDTERLGLAFFGIMQERALTHALRALEN